MGALGLGMVVTLSWMVLVNAWGDPRMTTLVVALILWATGAWAALHLLVRPTTLVHDDGLVVVNPLRTHRIRWADVLSVTHGNGPVRVHPRHGRPVPVWSSIELAPVNGEHPHAERVAAALSRRLDEARAQYRPAPRSQG